VKLKPQSELQTKEEKSVSYGNSQIVGKQENRISVHKDILEFQMFNVYYYQKNYHSIAVEETA
jgi:hypothetical protein